MKPRESLGLRKGYHSPQLDVKVRLNTNESPFLPPVEFYSTLEAKLKKLELNRYPDRGYHLVREALALAYDTVPERIFCGNGSNEVLLNLALSYGGTGRRAVVFEPTYSLHSHIAKTVGTEVLTLQRDEQFCVSASLVDHAESYAPDIVYLCSPNNPTGNLESAESIAKVLMMKTEPLVVLDEAYGDFAEDHLSSAIRRSENLVRLHTFSKWFNLAGLRFGFCEGSEEVVSVLDEVVLPYHIDELKQCAILTALELKDLFDLQGQKVKDLRCELYEGLLEVGVKAYSTDANFILMEFVDRDPKEIWTELVKQSILVRDTSNWPHLPPSLRVTVGTADENAAFLSALEKILARNN